MTDREKKLWYEGKNLWFEYVRINGYSWTFNDKGIKKLSKLLDLKGYYIRNRIRFYLEI
jgi:hypothetical protein